MRVIPSFTPNGKGIIVPNFRSNNVSIVDLERALNGHPNPEVARIQLVRTDGARVTPSDASGTVWIIDLRARNVVATVTAIGNDPYGLAVVEVDDD